MPVPAIDDSHLTSLWEEFSERYCQNKLKALEAQYPTQRSLIVDYGDIQKFDSELAELVVEKPDTAISALEKVVRKPTAGVLENIAFEPHVRISGLPERNLLIQNISSSHIDRLIAVKGVVSKRADVLHKVRIALYRCLMCDHRLRVPVTKKTVIPENCPECRRRSLKLDEEGSYFVDIQRAEMQELLERLKGGTPAARLELYMEDDLVNSITPGDTMVITGVVRLRPPLKSKNKNDQSGQIYTRYLDVLHIENDMRDFEEIDITREDEKQILELAKDPKIFDRIYKSIAPGIYGHDEVKQAVTLQMFGGTKNKKLPGGEPIRDDIHLLLIGDPGSAKTRMVQYACDLVPKGIYVSGKSVTGVGLTASAEKDEIGEGGWTLKAGALVLASGGLAGVDEFDKIDDKDRGAMHEVMESQSYHASTRLMLANGTEVEMGPFVESLLSKNQERVKQGHECLILDRGIDGIRVLTSDFDKIYPVQISQASKHKAPNHFYRVTLRNGRCLTVTPEHPFWTLAGADMSTTPASGLKAGAFTTIPAELPVVADRDGPFDPALFKFLGYHISDGGYEPNRGKKNGINFWNKDEGVLEDYLEAAAPMFASQFHLSTDARTGVHAARLTSMEAVGQILELDPLLMEKGSQKILPEHLMSAPDSCIREFLRAIFEGDGSISRRGTLGLVCENRRLADQVQGLLLRFGVEAHTILDGKLFRLYSTGGRNLEAFASKIGFVSDRKTHTLMQCIANKSGFSARRNWSYSEQMPISASVLLGPMRQLKLTCKETFGFIVGPDQPAFSRPVFARAVGAMRARLEEVRRLKNDMEAMGLPELARERMRLGISQAGIGGKRRASLVGYWERQKTMPDRYKALLAQCLDGMLAAETEVAKLEKLLKGRIRFCQITKVEKVPNLDQEWVYDVGAGPTKAFISECALLHNTVSIAKAGMVARFKAKCAILAAANPKFGRFDRNRLPAEQFDIPPTLLSRFDLIFVIFDTMDPVRDAELATKILANHRQDETPMIIEGAGLLDRTILTKYIAYARRNCLPALTNEAADKIKEYYVDLRKRGAQMGAVPITPRQIEGLVRMAEASAKLRLSPKVEAMDADRSINLQTFMINEILRDKETGRLDVDIIATGRPKSQVDKINNVLGITRELQKQFDLVEINKIIEEAATLNINEPDARRIIDELIYKGELYKVKHGFVKVVEQYG